MLVLLGRSRPGDGGACTRTTAQRFRVRSRPRVSTLSSTLQHIILSTALAERPHRENASLCEPPELDDMGSHVRKFCSLLSSEPCTAQRLASSCPTLVRRGVLLLQQSRPESRPVR